MEEFQAGGYNPQEKSCLVRLYTWKTPTSMYRRLGMEPPADLVTTADDADSVAMADCRVPGNRRVDRAAELIGDSLLQSSAGPRAPCSETPRVVRSGRCPTGVRLLAPTIDAPKTAWLNLGTLLPQKSSILILVTGATGFVGRRIVARLVERGEEVRRLVRPGPNSQSSGLPAVHFVTGDVTDPDSLKAACDGVDMVVHTVAIIREKGQCDFPEHQRAGDPERGGGGGRRRVYGKIVHLSAIGAGPDPKYPIPEIKVGGGGGRNQLEDEAT